MDLVDGVLLPQAEATQQATAAAYTNGRADYLDLLEAERILLDLRLDRIALRVRLLTEHATLDRLVPPLGGEPSDDR
jgi:outer membrane protein TolC